MSKFVDIVFDGPPGPTAARFVEVENESGASISFGEWVERDDGYWVLRIPDTAPALGECRAEQKLLEAEILDKGKWIDEKDARIKEIEGVLKVERNLLDRVEQLEAAITAQIETGWYHKDLKATLIAGDNGNE